MSQVESFPPIAAPDAKLLILGSMPGPASLVKVEYYGHPQNFFWKILGELAAFDPGASYPERVQALLAARIAVWDVLRRCSRPGALDSAIVLKSAETNDFAGFLEGHRQIRCIVFNGSVAEQIFRKRVLPDLQDRLARVQLVRLPSTSPANASIPFARKLEEWRDACAI